MRPSSLVVRGDQEEETENRGCEIEDGNEKGNVGCDERSGSEWLVLFGSDFRLGNLRGLVRNKSLDGIANWVAWEFIIRRDKWRGTKQLKLLDLKTLVFGIL